MKTIDRIHQYFEYKKIKPTRFEKENNISNGYFGVQKKRNADVGSTILETIIDKCRDLNPIWLLTGKGIMINNSNHFDAVTQIDNSTTFEYLEKTIQSKDDEIKQLNREIGKLEVIIEQLKNNQRISYENLTPSIK